MPFVFPHLVPKGKPASFARASKLVMFEQPLLSVGLAHLGVVHAVHVTDLIKWEISKISYIGILIRFTFYINKTKKHIECETPPLPLQSWHLTPRSASSLSSLSPGIQNNFSSNWEVALSLLTVLGAHEWLKCRAMTGYTPLPMFSSPTFDKIDNTLQVGKP